MRFLVLLSTLSVLVLILLDSAIAGSYFDSPYSIPDPKIEVFERGFRVGIPDDSGVHLFAFHGNINLPMNGLEAGMFSKDILKKHGDQWVFEDRRSVLKKGDVIYFWLFVIRDNLGYRYDDGRHIVNDIVAYHPLPDSITPDVVTPPTVQPASGNIPLTSTPYAPTPSPSTPITQEDPRCNLVLNLTDTVIYLTNDVKMLRENYQILVDIVEKTTEASRTLRFEGFLPPLDDPIIIAQRIIKEKIGLSGITVVTAIKNPDKSVTFTVARLSDKLKLITAAKDKLKNSKINLIY